VGGREGGAVKDDPYCWRPNHEERQAIPLPEPFKKIREALEKTDYIPVLDDTANYGQSWSPAQHCRSRP